MFSIRNSIVSAFLGASWFRFFVITSPAFENKRSLATDVAGIARMQRATAASDGYLSLLAAHQLRGHWLRLMDGSRKYCCSSPCSASVVDATVEAALEALRSSFAHMLSAGAELAVDVLGCGRDGGVSARAAAACSMARTVAESARWPWHTNLA